MEVRPQRSLSLALSLAGVLWGCAESPPSTSLYAHPWPSERLRTADGAIDLSGFPSGTNAPIRRHTEDALRDARGFGLSSGIFFPFDGPLDPTSLPDREAPPADEPASVFVIALDGGSPGARAPIDVRFLDDAGPFGGTDLLAILPYPGVPLEPSTLYAAVVTTRVRDASGGALPPLAQDDATRDDAERRALEQLGALGVDATDVAAFTVFRTGDPTRGLVDAYAHALAHDRPRLTDAPALVEVHEDYCVYASTIGMPDYQGGDAPYLEEGGGWIVLRDGSLVLQRTAIARVVITVPRAPSETAGYPGAVFVRAGGGGDRPLVDRGPRDAEGRSAPGAGLARELARAGYVAASFDGPLGGLRNLGGWDEQFVLFNVLNPIALRDNVRQSGLELALFAHVLEELDLDAAGCDGASPRARVQPGLVLIAHSNGATIAPLAAAVTPRYRALVLSGAGASWIRQIVYKQSPTPLLPIASVLFGYGFARETFEHDPMLSLMQWGGEPADPLVYGPMLRDRHVLVFQGVLDTYIPPPVSNPVALSLGLDLAGEALDRSLSGYRSLLDDLPRSGRGQVALPAQANDEGLTRVLIQHPEDGIEDGHEVLFQQPAARAQLECFLRTLRNGAPVVGRENDCPG